MNKKAKNELKVEEVESLVNDLKSLPSVKIPTDFEAKLRNKIAQKNNTNRQSKFFSFSNSQRVMIYGLSTCIVICIFIVFITSMNGPNSINTLDDQTFTHEGNKVTVIPPPNNEATGSVGNTGIGTTKNNGKLLAKEEYFSTQPDPNTSQVPDGNEQGAIGVRGINIDSLRIDSLKKIDSLKRIDSLKKIDSIKMELDSQNVTTIEYENK